MARLAPYALRGLIAVAALAAGAPGAAQDPPAAPNTAPAETAPAPGADTTIVVTGKAEPPAHNDVYDQAQDVSRVDPHMVYEVALPRFAVPLCPGVMGLEAKYAQAMADRMRSNAMRLRLPLARPGCSPNVLVAIVDDSQATLTALQHDHPDLFDLVPEAERHELLAGDSPVRVWNNIGVRWTGNGAPPPGWPKEKASFWGQLDRTSLAEAHDIHATLVLFDRSAVLGLTLTQLADYATMRGLSSTRPPTGDAPLATILSLFAGGPDHAPAELTRFDLGYLRSLYREGANRPAVSKLLAVRRESEAAQAR